MKPLLLGAILGTAAILTLAANSQTVAYPNILSTEFTQTFPYSMAGQLIFTSGKLDYQGSGTVVYKRSVLTAAHNCWDIDNGWSTYIEFNRARNGSAVPNQAYARRIYVFAGYQGSARRYGADSARALIAQNGRLRQPNRHAALRESR